MKTRKQTLLNAAASIFAVALSATAANAAVTFTSSATAPTIDGADIAMLNVSSVTADPNKDSVFSGGTDRPAQGQSFTTGSNSAGYLMSAATLYLHSNVFNTYDASLRVGTISGTAFTQIFYSAAVTSAMSLSTRYLTITVDTPILLAPNTVYGFDFGKANAVNSTGFTNGVVLGDPYTGGAAYTSGSAGVGNLVIAYRSPAADRVFHVDLVAVPEPSAALLGGLGLLALLRRRR